MDGYVLNMNRIRNPKSYNVVYFQHGVLDNSITWVVHGPIDSIAYQAYESGFDVFLGNFRGNYPRKTVPWKSHKSYWDYSVDDYAKYDIQAFLKKIYDIKIEEIKRIDYLDCQMSDEEIENEIREKLQITYIGHSLGGMTLLMYLVNQGIYK